MILHLLIFSSVLWAQAPSIQVTLVKGTVEAEGPKGFQKVKEGDRLQDGQVIRTQENATAVLVYPNGSQVKMNAGTNIKLHIDDGLDLLRGAVFSRVKKEKKPHFFVKTASAVAGVRGTEFFTSYGGDDTSNGWLCVKEGEVEVKPITNFEPVIVKAGMGIVIEANKKIEAPKKYEWTNHLNWNMDPSSGDVVDKTSTSSIYNVLKHNYD